MLIIVTPLLKDNFRKDARKHSLEEPVLSNCLSYCGNAWTGFPFSLVNNTYTHPNLNKTDTRVFKFLCYSSFLTWNTCLH